MVVKNVIEAILKYGHDEDFDPFADAKFLPTDAPAGSQEKIAVLRRRVELGQPLWHDHDRVDYSGLTGVIRPREDGQEDEDGTSGPDADISVELNNTDGSDSESYLDSAFKIHDDQSSLKLPKVSRGLGDSMADMRSKKNLSPQEEPAKIDFSPENRGKLRARMAEAVQRILLELRVALANKLLKSAEYSPSGLSSQKKTELVDLINTVALGREYSSQKMLLLAKRLGKSEYEVDDLMQNALISMKSKFFELLLNQKLDEEVAQVVQYAQSYFQSGELEKSRSTHLSIQSKSATALRDIGGLPARILEAGKSRPHSHGSQTADHQKLATRDIKKDASLLQASNLAKEAPQSAEPVNLSGKVFEDITLDKETCKNLAKDLWAKLQEDPKKLYSTALELPADGKLLSGERENEYFNRVFLLGLRGKYKSHKNSNYPSILHPLTQNKLDSYFKDTFFWNLNQHFSAIKERCPSPSSDMDAPGSESSISKLIYDAIPLELFKIWSPDDLWEPVLTARLSKQLKPAATAKYLNIDESKIEGIWRRICVGMPILKSICNSGTFGHARQTLTSP